MVLRLVAAVLLTRFRTSLLFQLGTCCRLPRNQRANRKQRRLLCLGSARAALEALDVLVAVVEVARAGPQSAAGRDQYRVGALCSETQFSKRHSLWPRRWAELHNVGERLRSDASDALDLDKGPPVSLVWVLLSTLSFGFKHWKTSSSSLLQASSVGKALLSLKVADRVARRIQLKLA